MPHDHKCKVCGKPATVNYQLVWIQWNIDKQGLFSNPEYHNCVENEFYCDNCWNKEREK